MRTTIRNELNDAGGTPLWPDAQLNEWLVEGLRDLGRQLGLEKSQSITSVANQGSYGLASDVVQVARVEHPAGYFRVPRAFASGDVSPEAILDLDPRVKPLELLYDVFGGSLVLSPAQSAYGESIGCATRGPTPSLRRTARCWTCRAATRTPCCSTCAGGRCSGSGRTRRSGSASSGSAGLTLAR